eukprot:359718-Chlamydomonas_euryale.AAC.10
MQIHVREEHGDAGVRGMKAAAWLRSQLPDANTCTRGARDAGVRGVRCGVLAHRYAANHPVANAPNTLLRMHKHADLCHDLQAQAWQLIASRMWGKLAA